MLLEFKTKRDVYGHTRYLCINTEDKTYTRLCPKIINPGIEIKSRDLKELTEKCKAEGFTEV